MIEISYSSDVRNEPIFNELPWDKLATRNYRGPLPVDPANYICTVEQKNNVSDNNTII